MPNYSPFSLNDCATLSYISNELNVKWLLATDVTAIKLECEIECVIVWVAMAFNKVAMGFWGAEGCDTGGGEESKE